MFLQVRRPNQQYQSNEGTKNTQITNNTLSKQTKTQQIPEGMVAKPERRWDCRRGTPQYIPDRPDLNYRLRSRHHNKTSELNDRDFIIRNLYKILLLIPTARHGT